MLKPSERIKDLYLHDFTGEERKEIFMEDEIGTLRAIIKYLDSEAERREKWEKEIEDKVKGLCEIEKMRAFKGFKKI